MLRAATVRAQEPAGEGVVRGDPVESARARVEGGARVATTVDLRDRGRAAESVGELLLEAPGLQLRRMGDGFAPQAVSMRGAPAAHVVFALDGVVLNTAASDDVDLSLVPPSLLERADVYRGAIPLRFGASGLAGAVELLTRSIPSRPTAWVGAGYGSFGARRGGVFVAARARGVQGLFALGYRGTDGDFSYYDTRGTDDPRDDGEATRRNNAADAVDLLGRVCLGDGPARELPCAQLLAGFRRRGLSGIAGYPTDGPFSEQRRASVRVTAPLRRGAWVVEFYGAASAREDRVDNGGPVPIATAARGLDAATGWSGEGGATLRFARGRWRLEGVARVRGEGVVAAAPGSADGWRVGGLFGAELGVTAGPLLVEAGVGAEVLGDRGGSVRAERAVVSPRVGARWRVSPALELRANGAWLQRAPTLVELYGDRSVIAGNADLRNERAWNADLGAVLRAGSAGWSLRVEASAFARAVENVVVLRQTDRALYRPVNRDEASSPGCRS
jgi:outer membrane receptor protein involved in Fe transport